MEYKVFGMKVRVEVVVLSVIVGMVIGATMLCSCTTVESEKEGFSNNLQGSPLNAQMEPNTWITKAKQYSAKVGNGDAGDDQNTYTAGQVPLPQDQLFFFYDNQFKPNCCMSSQYSNSMGCACVTKEQNSYLNQRGGNRTHSTEF